MKKKNFLLPIFIALGLFGAQASYASSPEIVSALRKINDARSANFQLNIPLEFSVNENIQKANIKLGGIILDTNNSKTDQFISLDVDYKGNFLEQQIGEKGFYFSLESINSVADKADFARLTRYSNFMEDFIDLSKIKNQWFKLNSSTSNEIINSFVDEIDPTSSLTDTLNLNSGSDQPKTAEQKAKEKILEESFYRADIFNLSQPAQEKIIDGKTAKIYKFKVNAHGLLIYLASLDPKNQPTAKEFAQTEKEFNKALKLNEGTIIETSDSVQLIWPFEINIPEENLYIKTSLDLTISRINDSNLKIEIPKNYLSEKDLETLLSGNSSYTPYSEESASDSKTISDIRQIRTALEMYYNNTGTYPTKLGKKIASKYVIMSKVPTETARAKDSACYNHQYKYTAIKNKAGKIDSYTLEYCIESETYYYSYSGGINIATPITIAKAQTASEIKSFRAKTIAKRQFSYKQNEKEINRNLENIKNSQNNLRISLRTEAQAAFIIEMIREYYKDSGEFPKTLTSGKALTFGKNIYIQKVPTHLQYYQAQTCQNPSFSYEPVTNKSGKVIDFYFQYCLENNPSDSFYDKGEQVITREGNAYSPNWMY